MKHSLPLAMLLFFLACKSISPTTKTEQRHGMAGYWMQRDRQLREAVPVAARVSNDSLIPSDVCCLVNGLVVDSVSWSLCVRLRMQENVDAYADSLWRPHLVGQYLVAKGESYRLDSLRRSPSYRKLTDRQWKLFLQQVRDGLVDDVLR